MYTPLSHPSYHPSDNHPPPQPSSDPPFSPSLPTPPLSDNDYHHHQQQQHHHYQHHLDDATAAAMLAAEQQFARLCLAPQQQQIPRPSNGPYADDNYSYDTFAPEGQTSLKDQRPSPMLLLNDPNVDQELKLIAQKLVKKQRSDDGSASGLSLFIILPVLDQGIHHHRDSYHYRRFGNGAQEEHGDGDEEDDEEEEQEEDFRLYFLCDYGGREDTSPKLHVCDYGSRQQQHWGVDDMEIDDGSAAGRHPHHRHQQQRHHRPEHHQPPQPQHGHRLKDLEDFLSAHTIPMLSLLRTVEENIDLGMPGTAHSDPMLANRIRIAIRFLASRVHEELLEFQESPSPSEEECDDYDSCLQESDFLETITTISSGNKPTNHHAIAGNNDNISSLVGMANGGGALCQMSNAMMLGEGVLWLCRAHNEMYCKAPAAYRLREFIHHHGGDCIPMEKSAEIQLVRREDAAEFYRMLIEYQCVMKLKISLAWPGGVTEEDLWRLCEVVHRSTLRELTLDCNADTTTTAGLHQQPHPLPQQETVDRPGFRPLLGMLCRLGFVSLTVENYAGDLFPGGASIMMRGRTENFSWKAFRDSNAELMVVPENIPLKKLALRHWIHYPDTDGLSSVARCCPQLTELECQTERLENVYTSLHQATNGTLNKIQYLLLSESPSEVGWVSFKRLENGQQTMSGMQRRTSRELSPWLEQCLGIVNYSVLRCVRMWENMDLLHNFINSNIVTMESLDFVCRADYLTVMWRFLAEELDQAFQILEEQRADEEAAEDEESFEREPIRLRLKDEQGNGLESACPHESGETTLALKYYDDAFRPHLKSLSRFAATVSFEQEFTRQEDLDLLWYHVVEDGLYFPHLAWHISPRNLNNVAFLSTLQALVHHPEVQQFTVRIDNNGSSPSLVQMLTLLQSWNDLTGMSLRREECGRWMQECVAQLEHPFKTTVRLPNGTGELTFASENMVDIGASASTMCPSYVTASKGGVPGGRRGPRIYSLSCRRRFLMRPSQRPRSPDPLPGEEPMELSESQEKSSSGNLRSAADPFPIASPVAATVQPACQSSAELSTGYHLLRATELEQSLPSMGSAHQSGPSLGHPTDLTVVKSQRLRHPSQEILTLSPQLDTKSGYYFILWEDICQLCKGAQYLLNGETVVSLMTDDDFEEITPLRIEYIPDAVIDVVLENPGDVHGSERSSIGYMDRGIQRATGSITSDSGIPVECQGSVLETEQQSTMVLQALNNPLTMQERIKAVLFQDHYPKGSPTPRLITILPTPLHFTRLFFMCEYDIFTAGEGTGTEPTIHLSPSDGYEILNPDGLFDKCGAHILTTMQFVKYGYCGPELSIPPLNMDSMLGGNSQKDGELTTDDLWLAVDDKIARLQERLVATGSCQSNDQNASGNSWSAGTEYWSQLSSFVDLKDKDGVYGELHRFITDDGYAKWECSAHYQGRYAAATRATWPNGRDTGIEHQTTVSIALDVYV
ncbi:hypothetical protein BGX28_002398 [Mortierella sp. GBA30]|nr:hypothetical protein BGX28_002398 [Mortierella sp. GBA30]